MNKKKRVLLIDDEEVVTESLTLNLQASGQFKVQAVNDPTTALDVARRFHPDIIILDIVMPLMDGGDVQHAIRTDPELKDIPIILCTALISNAEVGEGTRETGGDYILAKPVKLPVLMKLINELT